jgi:hypothetical protein
MKFDELCEAFNMSYEDWKSKRDELAKAHGKFEAELIKKFPDDGRSGYSQETLDNPAFQRLFKKERLAFKALQDINASAPKDYKRRASRERRTRH